MKQVVLGVIGLASICIAIFFLGIWLVETLIR
jgi:hypothetical protein